MENFKKYIDKLTQEFLKSEKRPLNRVMTPNDLKGTLNLEVPQNQQDTETIETFINNYLKYSVNTNDALYANQLWSKVSESSVLGEYLASITNTSMYTYEVAPVATLLEHEVVHELTKRIWGKITEGVMTSGGTASNLQALMVARNVKFPQVKDSGLYNFKKRPVILAASNAHYSIKRAANILGLGHKGFLEVPVNDNGIMTAESVQSVIESNPDVNIFALVSTAGTTVEGAFDNLKEISKVCKQNNIWFHVDGAYGASVLLSEKNKKLMDGVELADSLSWDFHKMLGLNLPCAFLMTKEKGLLKGTLSSDNDSYLFHDDDSLDLGPKSLQCGRRNDILKLWITFMDQGMTGLGERVDKLFELSDRFSKLVDNSEELTLISRPQSINICFRFKSGSNQVKAIREKLSEQSKLMINYSSDNDGDFFRLAVTNPYLDDTHLQTIIKNIIMVKNELN